MTAEPLVIESSKPGTLRIRAQRYVWSDIIRLGFGLLFAGFTAVMLWMLASGGGADLFAWLIVSAFATFAMLGLYDSVTRLTNYVELKIDGQMFTVRHGPLPRWGGFSLPLDEIDFLSLATVRHTHNSNSPGSGRHVYYTHRLSLATVSGADRFVHDDPRSQRMEEIVESIRTHTSVRVFSGHEDAKQRPSSPVALKAAANGADAASSVSASALPPQIRVEGRRIGIGWFHPGRIVWIAVNLALFLPVGFAGLMGLAMAMEFGGVALLGVLIPFIFTAALLGMLYVNAACCVNTTWLEFSRSSLQKTHGPLPWTGELDVSLSEIRRLRVEYESQQDASNMGRLRCFSVAYDALNGGTTILYPSLTLESAEFVVQWLNEQRQTRKNK